MKDNQDYTEIWKEVSINTNYEVSNLGRVRRKEYTSRHKNGMLRIYKATLLKPIVGKSSCCVSIHGKSMSIAKLVAKAFLDDGKRHYIIYHKNGDITDNRVDNLSYTNQTILFDKDEELNEKEYLEKYYDISPCGVVTRRSDGKVLKPVNGPKGYIYIRLKSPKFSKNNDRRKSYKIHRLVAMFYLPNYSDSLQVNHKNGIKTDNRVENLEMVTNRENVIHAWRVLDSSNRKQILSENNKKRGVTKLIESAAIANRKMIAKINKKNEVVEIFGSLTDASKSEQCSLTAISYAVKHNTKSCGYYWKYL